MKFKGLFCRHSWTEYFYRTHRSCVKCKVIEMMGFTDRKDDWHPVHDEDVRKAFINLLKDLGFRC